MGSEMCIRDSFRTDRFTSRSTRRENLAGALGRTRIPLRLALFRATGRAYGQFTRVERNSAPFERRFSSRGHPTRAQGAKIGVFILKFLDFCTLRAVLISARCPSSTAPSATFYFSVSLGYAASAQSAFLGRRSQWHPCCKSPLPASYYSPRYVLRCFQQPTR